MLGRDTVLWQGTSIEGTSSKLHVHEDLITDACKLDGTVPATSWAATTTFISLAANQELLFISLILLATDNAH